MKEKTPVECPCENCLVRVPCRHKMCRNGYLIIQEIRDCYLADIYLDKFKCGHHEYYDRIYKICSIFDVGKQFVWHHCEV